MWKTAKRLKAEHRSHTHTRLVTEKHSENQRSFLALMSPLSLSSSCLISRDTFPQSRGAELGTIAMSAETPHQHVWVRFQTHVTQNRPEALLSPVFPMIFSHGWSVRMLSNSGEMRGVRDHSLTVLSRLQLAMVNGRLWWHVKPAHTYSSVTTQQSAQASMSRHNKNHSWLIPIKASVHWYWDLIIICLIIGTDI